MLAWFNIFCSLLVFLFHYYRLNWVHLIRLLLQMTTPEKRKVQMSMSWTLSSLDVETTIMFKNTKLTLVSSSLSCPWWTSTSMLVTWRHGYFWWEVFLLFIRLPHWSHMGMCPNPGTLPPGPIPVRIQLHFLPKFLLQYTLGRNYLTFFFINLFPVYS